MKPFTLYKGTPPKHHKYRGFTPGERVIVREGLFAGHHGVIHHLRADGRPVLLMDNGAIVNCEDAGQWLRPDKPVVEITYRERCGFPMGSGEIKRRAGAL